MLAMKKRHVQLRVAELLEERGITQEELAEKADLHITTVGRLVRDANDHIALETIRKVCVALDVTPNDIFSYTSEEFKNGDM
jgi:DNA-binding Xre family transcriptional regulator